MEAVCPIQAFGFFFFIIIDGRYDIVVLFANPEISTYPGTILVYVYISL